MDKKALIKQIDKAVSSLVSWQNASQKVLILVAPHIFKGEAEAGEVVEHFLAKLDKYDGRFAMEKRDLCLYLNEVMGIAIDEENNTVSYDTFDKDDARARFDKMKETPWYKYRNKLLTVPSDKVNVTAMARRIALGLTTIEEAEAIIDAAKRELAKLSTDKKVVDWVEKYNSQHKAA